jgi:crotonobetainyl-CoA:carnitine CoA-transferase CaiB-like acyl-CoA transferase
MDRRGVPSAPINSYPEILADPQVRHMGLVMDLRLANGVATKTVGFPVTMTDYRFAIDGTPPKLGEHNDEVFAQWLEI